MKKIIDYVNAISKKNVLFVLKGYPLSMFNIEKCNIGQTIDNKIMRLFDIAKMDKPIISFDEFVCLFDLAIQQFSKIYIIENTLYWGLYPVDSTIDDNTAKKLLAHYNDEASPESDVGGLYEYVNIYSNFISTEYGYACCYNLDNEELKREKIILKKFNVDKEELKTTSIIGNDKIIEIYTHEDYFKLLYELYNSKEVFTIWGDLHNEIFKYKIELLNAHFKNRLLLYLNTEKKSINHNKEILEIMKKYWGYDSYRSIKMYDINKLDSGIKEIQSISQEQIINDLVEQTENCINNRAFRDIFVTAPTGSGKSIMFQLPAIYLAEKYKLMTLVITPLIGLMKDQTEALKRRGYDKARTINSDVSPIIKQEIIEDIENGKCDILYLSPETLLSRSDIEQLIGKRKIGMIVVDEAHIVTTWGKQFRPDYWYLGDHVSKLRKKQSRDKESPSNFIIATFTATAIYGGHEDMYSETINSMNMINPIAYLGYVKRDNISIEVKEIENKRNKVQYENDKFLDLIDTIKKGLVHGQKILIYFPTVALINRFFSFCSATKWGTKYMSEFVTRYHGRLDAVEKEENFNDFLTGKKNVMIATKAFGMGIDIPDISIVAHYAPTGNVCDYMQEIGRAARDSKIEGHAIYNHMSSDFSHINRLHGLSTIRKYQLIDVITKILEIYNNTRYNDQTGIFTKKRNEMLVDAECFSYIFEGPMSDENDLINKVKTAMLLIQKDYETSGSAPFYIKPIPLFAYGFFSIDKYTQNRLNKKYPKSIECVFNELNICKVNLKNIWERDYSNKYSFPKFKFMLYTKSNELKFNEDYIMTPALSIDIKLNDESEIKFKEIIEYAKTVVAESIYKSKYLTVNDMVNSLCEKSKINKYKAENIINILLATMDVYRKNFASHLNSSIYVIDEHRGKATDKKSERIIEKKYLFHSAVNSFFVWVQKNYRYIIDNLKDDVLYVINEDTTNKGKEIMTVLGLLEAFGILNFKALGGSNSQIYIYVNETKRMFLVKEKPQSYQNRLLEMVDSRHKESVRMLTYLFQSNFTSDEIWEKIENYFVGILPEEIKQIN